MLPEAAYSKILLEHVLKDWIVDWLMLFNSGLGAVHGPSMFHMPPISVHLTLVYGYKVNLLTPTGYVMHQQFNLQQLYALFTPYLSFVFI